MTTMRVQLLAVPLIFSIASMPAHTQSGPECIGGSLASPRSVSGDEKADSERAVLTVKSILAAIGSSDSIEVFPAPIDGACAGIGQLGNRTIHFGPRWLEEYSADDPWVFTAILAHEVGHHVNNHRPRAGDLYQNELAADVFVGRTIKLLGGSLDDALRVVATESNTGHNYPPREHREVAIRKGYQQGDAGMPSAEGHNVANALRGLERLTGDRAREVLRRAELYLRSGASDPAQGSLIVQSIVGHIDHRSNDPIQIESLERVIYILNSVPDYWWRREDWNDPRDYTRQMMSHVDRLGSAGISVVPSRLLPAYRLLKRSVGYVVPPDRIVSVGPFRMRMDYCPMAACDIKMALHGYDVRGNLRFDSSKLFSSLRSGDVVDTTLDTSDRLYFDAGPLEMNVVPVRFALFCLIEGQVIAGSSVDIGWQEENEAAFGGYATWLSCDNSSVRASIGLGVNVAANRDFEPPVKLQPSILGN